MAAELVFLGTGGGRFVAIGQMRATGGLYLSDRNNRIHIDPGPGALLKLHERGIDPSKTSAILVTHCHPDHYADSEILIEAMTGGCRRVCGTFLASRSIIDGIPGHGPAVSAYHRGRIGDCRAVSPGDRLDIGGTKIDVVPAFHSDPSGVGFGFDTEGGRVVWGSDTRYDDGLLPAYRNARVLILSVTTPLKVRIPFHLNTEDAAAIAKECRPELCVITHFGVRMLESGVDMQASWIEKESGVRTVAAADGMIIKPGKTISISRPGGRNRHKSSRM